MIFPDNENVKMYFIFNNMFLYSVILYIVNKKCHIVTARHLNLGANPASVTMITVLNISGYRRRKLKMIIY